MVTALGRTLKPGDRVFVQIQSAAVGIGTITGRDADMWVIDFDGSEGLVLTREIIGRAPEVTDVDKLETWLET